MLHAHCRPVNTLLQLIKGRVQVCAGTQQAAARPRAAWGWRAAGAAAAPEAAGHARFAQPPKAVGAAAVKAAANSMCRPGAGPVGTCSCSSCSRSQDPLHHVADASPRMKRTGAGAFAKQLACSRRFPISMACRRGEVRRLMSTQCWSWRTKPASCGVCSGVWAPQQAVAGAGRISYVALMRWACCGRHIAARQLLPSSRRQF